jgi:pimeloyl-ACP methyl ester carboxylesterase
MEMRGKIMISIGKQWFRIVAASVAAGLLLPMAAVQAEAKTSEAKPQIVALEDAGVEKRFNFAIYANIDLQKSDAKIQRVIIFQHGLKRDADRYFEVATHLLDIAGKDPAENAVLAPNFAVPSDNAAGDNMPLWHGSAWLQGHPSSSGVTGISSFSVIDDIARFVTAPGRFPALKEIIFIGHSAGAQLLQRYAVLNKVAESLQKSGISVRYVISSPSSYLYLDANRPNGDVSGIAHDVNFAPAGNILCPGYDNYRYGIKKMIAYGRGLDGEQLFRRYAARNVTYLVGAEDNNPNHPLLDKSCGARLEGSGRANRQENYLRYEQFLSNKWGIPVKREHAQVPGAGHEADEVFGSSIAAEKVFGGRK